MHAGMMGWGDAGWRAGCCWLIWRVVLQVVMVRSDQMVVLLLVIALALLDECTYADKSAVRP